MRLIDADNLKGLMYHDAFETDTDEQRYDSGLWIRYRLFERNLESTPEIDAVPVVRCRDCECATMTTDGKLCKYCEQYVDDDGRLIQMYRDADWFCADGEKGERE